MVGAVARQVTASSEHTKGILRYFAYAGHRYGCSQGVQTRAYRTVLHQVQTGDAGYYADGRRTRVCLVSTNYQEICVISGPGDTDGGHVDRRQWCNTRTSERYSRASERGRAESCAEERGDDSPARTRVVHCGATVELGGVEEQCERRYGH